MPKEDTQFKSQGKGIPHSTKPIAVKYPAAADAALRVMGNRSEYIRRAVMAALERDELL